MTYMVRVDGKIVARALPKVAADAIAQAMGGKAIIDPRCIQR